MKPSTSLAACLLLAVSIAGPAKSENALPPGATMAKNAQSLRSYTPSSNPGAVNFNAADRMAIANLLYAYAFAYDNYEADSWFSLFTEDAVFVAGMPGSDAISFTGEGFRTFWRKRMETFRTSGNQRRHLMDNILFLEETDTTAHVSVAGLLTNVKDGKDASVVSSLNYEGWLVKDDEGWKIQRWHDFPDAAF